MPQWWDQIERGIGQQYQPNYGTLSPVNQYQANRMAMTNLGFGLLANADKKLPVAMGRAGQGLQRAGQNALQSQAAMLDMADTQKERKKRDETLNQWQKFVDENTGRFGEYGPMFRNNPALGMKYLMEQARPLTPEDREAFGIQPGQGGYVQGGVPTVFNNSKLDVTWQTRMVPDGKGGMVERNVAVDNQTLQPVADAGPTKKWYDDQQEQKTKQEAAAAIAARTLPEIERALEMINNDAGAFGIKLPKWAQNPVTNYMIGDMPAAGPGTEYLSKIPGTDAYYLADQLAGIMDKTGLQALMAAKAGSSTGASGFGALSERELAVLQNSYGNLRQTQDPEVLKENMIRVYELMAKAAGKPVKLSFDVDKAFGEVGDMEDFETRKQKYLNPQQ